MGARKLNNGLNVISNNLTKYREMRHLSQAGLASNLNLLGIPTTKNDISNIECNKRTARDYELWGIVQVLNIQFEDLFLDISEKLYNES